MTTFRKTHLAVLGLLVTTVSLAPAPAPAARVCALALHLDDEVTLGSLQLDLEYAATGGSFLADGENVDCTSEAPNAIGEFFDDTQDATLHASWLSLDTFTGPTRLATCSFLDETDMLTADQFTVVGVAAGDADANPVPFPAVSVRLPDCDVSTPSTTTTSTVPSTTTTLPPTFCDVTIGVTTSHQIASLDWTLDYQNAFGEFEGESGSVSCTNLVSGALKSYKDIDDSRRILGAVIKSSNFSTPAAIAECTFLPVGIDEPLASDFSVFARGATDVELETLDPLPTMAITAIECTTPAVCGNGEQELGEDCDDGNKVGGDGCSAACTLEPICGDADENRSIQAADALRVLRRAVGSAVTCPLYVCDTDDNGAVQAADALRVLKKAVGVPVTLTCPLAV